MSESDVSQSNRQAVALRYREPEDEAPRVVAKGHGQIAAKIVALAREHDIPTYADSELTRHLATLDLDMEIPSQLYQAVAEVLVFIYELEQSRKDPHGPANPLGDSPL